MSLIRIPYYEEQAEVSGEVVYGMSANLRADAFTPLLEKHGLSRIDPAEWYPIQVLMDIFAVLEKDSTSFVALGIAIADHSIMPEGLDRPTMTQMLLAWNDHYQVNHRGGKVSTVTTHKYSDAHYAIELPVTHTYPFDLVYGLVYGFARKLIPEGTSRLVEYDVTQNPQNPEAQRVLIHVYWGEAADKA